MSELRKKINQKLAELAHAKRTLQEEKLNLQQAEDKLSHTEQARTICQEIAETVQNQAHAQISSIVTRCLQAVFGEEAYEFQIQFEQKRGKTEAKLLFVRDGLAVDPVEASGGGVIDLASFALRLACLVIQKPAKRKILVLDEPMKHLSADYQPVVAELIESLARELGIQFLITTHNELMQVGKVVRV